MLTPILWLILLIEIAVAEKYWLQDHGSNNISRPQISASQPDTITFELAPNYEIRTIKLSDIGLTSEDLLVDIVLLSLKDGDLLFTPKSTFVLNRTRTTQLEVLARLNETTNQGFPVPRGSQGFFRVSTFDAFSQTKTSANLLKEFRLDNNHELKLALAIPNPDQEMKHLRSFNFVHGFATGGNYFIGAVFSYELENKIWYRQALFRFCHSGQVDMMTGIFLDWLRNPDLWSMTAMHYSATHDFSMILVGHTSTEKDRGLIEIRPMKDIIQTMDQARKNCSQGSEFTILLESVLFGGNSSCQKETSYHGPCTSSQNKYILTSVRARTFKRRVMDTPINGIFGVSVSIPFTGVVIFTASDNVITRCKFSNSEKKLNCARRSVTLESDAKFSSIIRLEHRTGMVQFYLQGTNQIVSQPLHDCSDFIDCLNCEMYAGIFGCIWTMESCQPSSDPQSSPPPSTSCKMGIQRFSPSSGNGLTGPVTMNIELYGLADQVEYQSKVIVSDEACEEPIMVKNLINCTVKSPKPGDFWVRVELNRMPKFLPCRPIVIDTRIELAGSGKVWPWLLLLFIPVGLAVGGVVVYQTRSYLQMKSTILVAPKGRDKGGPKAPVIDELLPLTLPGLQLSPEPPGSKPTTTKSLMEAPSTGKRKIHGLLTGKNPVKPVSVPKDAFKQYVNATPGLSKISKKKTKSGPRHHKSLKFTLP